MIYRISFPWADAPLRNRWNLVGKNERLWWPEWIEDSPHEIRSIGWLIIGATPDEMEPGACAFWIADRVERSLPSFTLSPSTRAHAKASRPLTARQVAVNFFLPPNFPPDSERQRGHTLDSIGFRRLRVPSYFTVFFPISSSSYWVPLPIIGLYMIFSVSLGIIAYYQVIAGLVLSRHLLLGFVSFSS